ncbi:M14 family metallopeptidase [Singulisphaera acidiphila]|uniref:Putative carboxypeptidase n=1 Tax=Singulisphaera acidiphila (strain ATCC BAA-1392 / DSM 18658 / VKM B-2454 / MOB10) TaxID=886293 RepID=L0DNI9_SINAD|nr:M14 metallopeptidase family protein [Singulisphaera acidiphila]AGA30256.1 putative carboxypeptidase [Singulisphaera acidiphila DSM 18658]
MPSSRQVVLVWLLLAGFVLPCAGADVPSPEAHLGYRPGADFHLAAWPAVVDYFREVDEASDRVLVRNLGESTEGRPYIVAVVSSSETIKDLPKYQQFQRRLSHPGLTATTETPDPVAESKPVVVITCSIHSTETASTLMAMELLHELASKDDPATRAILDSTILLLVPSANPDGVDKVAHWYERSKGHPWEGSGLPELYHKYAGHDTNRDWFMLNLKETRLLTQLLYQEWMPTILYDVHQMGSRGARLFVPPFYDPINPNLDARIHQSIFMIGAHMAGDLAAAGKQGVLTNAMYDNWWNGGNRTTPQRHNIVAVLTEAASVRMASPIFLERGDLSGGSRGFRDHAPTVNFVDPWPGGWWRLRDIVDYELICARSILTLAASYRQTFQTNLQAMARNATRKGENEPPFAWVVPRNQRDPGTASELVRILHASGIEVRRATQPFQADGVSYEAGAWILPAAQPYRSHLKDMMERQVYPSRFTAGGVPETPYDVAGWTLPLQMGVQVSAVGTRFSADSEPLERIELIQGQRSGESAPKYFALGNQANDDFVVVNALLDAGVIVKVNEASGHLSFPADAQAEAVLSRVLPTVSSQLIGHANDPSPKLSRELRRGRIGVYQPWDSSMDEGWTRLVLEKFRIPYTTLHNAEIRAGGLKERIETLVIASIEPRTLSQGYSEGQTEPKYVGGLGPEGAAALRAFVEAGGTLVCLENSCDYAITEFALPVVNVLKGVKSSRFYAPGSIVRVTRTGTSSLTRGVSSELSAYFDHSLAFDVPENVQRPGKVGLRYAGKNLLESGWLLGPEVIQGKAALVEFNIGPGRVVLFGFPPQHRGQPHGTFRLLFNSFYREEDPSGQPPK